MNDNGKNKYRRGVPNEPAPPERTDRTQPTHSI